MKNFTLLFAALTLFSCKSPAQENKDLKTEAFTVVKTKAEWKAELSEMEYYVLREEGTERAGSSPLDKVYESGTFICAACNTPLFKSEHKFDSGTGWPSFDRPIEGNVAYGSDNKLGYSRDEEHCATCGSHLGHVFNDGPRDTTGKRHCINGISLNFIPKGEKLPTIE
jgi:peptide-methionine (R)-S-oxide reductase